MKLLNIGGLLLSLSFSQFAFSETVNIPSRSDCEYHFHSDDKKAKEHFLMDLNDEDREARVFFGESMMDGIFNAELITEESRVKGYTNLHVRVLGTLGDLDLQLLSDPHFGRSSGTGYLKIDDKEELIFVNCKEVKNSTDL